MPNNPQASGGGGATVAGVVALVLVASGVAGFLVFRDSTQPQDKQPEEVKAPPVSIPARKPNFKGKTLCEWVAGLKDEDRNTRRDSATRLIEIDPAGSTIPSAGVADLLIEAETLKDLDADVRQLTVYVLGNIKASNETLIPALTTALRDPDARVRRVAATAVVTVGRRDSPSIQPLVRDALADRDPEIRQLAKSIQEELKATAVAMVPVAVPVLPPARKDPMPKEAKPRDPPGAVEPVKGVGKLAPEVQGEDLDGVRFKLSDYRGKIVVLTFWAEY